ncbi:hypothetical protein HHL19_20255 [Streptomyces sp. R302]|uniref:hypothetical protein n=1 Tax=unclassified Streptomyces TaxID=2593676 RepID=UPI00145FC367|nr:MULTISPECIES: hypothetical protein [unclassified Streptomyces]NML50842.1 hypothetical protein [Streptomyces sp. R301]NML80936.1 hypothetical protein [Streptomyces sp. R302]
MEVCLRQRSQPVGGPGAAAYARREVHRLADQALFFGQVVRQASEDDAALIASELVAHAGGLCVLELRLASDGLDILVMGARPPSEAATAHGPYVFWWDLVTLLARDVTVRRSTPASGAVVRAHVDTECPPG